ncbi:MAG TPA: Gldg family protein [Burkholderiales bacterium]|nr:Gldg family protein [Burkholderiales bacterium]
MDKFFRSGLIFIAGLALLVLAGAIYMILLEGRVVTTLIAATGLVLSSWGAYSLRAEFSALLRQRRGEILLHCLGVVGVLCAIAYFSVQFPARLDMTEEGRYSLSEQTVKVLRRLENPVHIAFFHDPLMREQVELYELMGRQTDKLRLEFFDPMLNPAQARLRGVQFAGTALLESEGRKIQLNSHSETEIANAILRISLGVTQNICFLDGHREADPFSQESHDHLEGGAAGHTHGLGAIYVMYEQHGMSKARGALETLNYTVEKLTLSQRGATEKLGKCSLLVVAGPKEALMPTEVEAIRHFLAAGGNGFFMLDPFTRTGIEPVLREYGIVLDNTIIIDESSHFWADPSSPAVTEYNYHPIAQDLPLTFFPGARSLSPTQRVPRTDVIPMINSSKQSFGETDPARARFDKGKDQSGPLTIMAVATRRPVPAGEPTFPAPGSEQADEKPLLEPSVPVTGRSRIAVIGDSDFATNSFFHVMGNGRLFLNTVNYLASKENLIGMEPRARELPRVNLTNRQMKGTFFLAIVLVPALLAAIGCAVWWKQR